MRHGGEKRAVFSIYLTTMSATTGTGEKKGEGGAVWRCALEKVKGGGKKKGKKK